MDASGDLFSHVIKAVVPEAGDEVAEFARTYPNKITGQTVTHHLLNIGANKYTLVC
jgi:hypothetical protein